MRFRILGPLEVLSADGWTALEAYSQARQVISDELGVDPGSELQRLYRELLAADASAASTTHRPSRSPVVAAVPDPVAPVRRTDTRTTAGRTGPPTLRRHRAGRPPRGRGPSRRAPSRSVPSPNLRWLGRGERPGRPMPTGRLRRAFHVPRSFPRTSGTSPGARRMSLTCARCLSAKRRRAVPARCGSRW